MDIFIMKLKGKYSHKWNQKYNCLCIKTTQKKKWKVSALIVNKNDSTMFTKFWRVNVSLKNDSLGLLHLVI